MIEISVENGNINFMINGNDISEYSCKFREYIEDKITYCCGYIDGKYRIDDDFNKYTKIDCMTDFEHKYINGLSLKNKEKIIKMHDKELCDYNMYQDIIESLENENSKIIGELKHIKKENEELNNKLQSKKYKLKDIESKLKYKDKCIEDLNREIRKKEAEIRRLHKIITQSRQQ